MTVYKGRWTAEAEMSPRNVTELLDFEIEWEDVECPACTGTGYETTDPEDSSTCLDCNGTGLLPSP